MAEKTIPSPPWYIRARAEIGTRELPGNRGPAIRRYIQAAHAGKEGDAWCAIFTNAMLESAGVKGTRSASSQSFAHSKDFKQLTAPALGCLVVYWRIRRTSGLGHVGFYAGEDNHGFINTLGGNESDMVRDEFMNPKGATFGLVGYYWPKDFPMPQLGKLVIAHNATLGTGKVI